MKGLERKVAEARLVVGGDCRRAVGVAVAAAAAAAVDGFVHVVDVGAVLAVAKTIGINISNIITTMITFSLIVIIIIIYVAAIVVVVTAVLVYLVTKQAAMGGVAPLHDTLHHPPSYHDHVRRPDDG